MRIRLGATGEPSPSHYQSSTHQSARRTDLLTYSLAYRWRYNANPMERPAEWYAITQDETWLRTLLLAREQGWPGLEIQFVDLDLHEPS